MCKNLPGRKKSITKTEFTPKNVQSFKNLSFLNIGKENIKQKYIISLNALVKMRIILNR